MTTRADDGASAGNLKACRIERFRLIVELLERWDGFDALHGHVMDNVVILFPLHEVRLSPVSLRAPSGLALQWHTQVVGRRPVVSVDCPSHITKSCPHHGIHMSFRPF